MYIIYVSCRSSVASELLYSISYLPKDELTDNSVF